MKSVANTYRHGILPGRNPVPGRLPFVLPLIFSFLLFSPAGLFSQSPEDQWVDSIYNVMSLDERIGQLFMIRAHSDLGPDHISEVIQQIKKYQVGGLCFFQGTAEKQSALTNRYQVLSNKVPMMIAMDAEWGLSMRYKEGVIEWPHAIMLGAIQDNSLIYDYGQQIGAELSRIGVHMNFAPVVDVNNNARNPVINHRSFGEDKYNVTTKSYMYMRGMQDNNVAACAKHFPGHGDTDVDSHHDLPVIHHDMDRLENVELFPFKTLIKHGIASVMVAHLNVPAIDDRPGRPTSLSEKMIDQQLRRKMGFNGLVFTDGLEMGAVADRFENGIVEVEALKAGTDVLLLPNDIEKAFQEIKKHIEEGSLSMDRISESVKRVLRTKYQLGLHEFKAINETGIRLDLNNSRALSLKHRLIENALTLVRNEESLVPLTEGSANIASLAIGTPVLSHFQVMLNEYEKIPRHILPHQISEVQKTETISKLASKDAVVVSIHNMSQRAGRDFGLDPSTISLIQGLSLRTKVILVVFGNPYSLKFFDDIDNVVVCYEDDRLTQNIAAQAIFGAVGFKGRLPVTASDRSTFGMGIDTKSHLRIGYSVPERVGMSVDSIREVDRIIYELMQKKAAPGAQLLVAKEGKVVYQKEYGYHTYKKVRPVQRDHLYDLASVTKVTAATLAVMKLYEEGKLDLNTPISNYLPELKGTNKASMTLEQIMTHKAGLKPWLPFYRATLDDQKKPDPKYYRDKPSEAFNVRISEGLYLRSDYPDTIFQMIVDTDLRKNRSYRYSDLGFYMIARIIERVGGARLDNYVRQHFFDPLHMSRTTYNPLDRVRKDEVVPTEVDNYYRHCDLQGYVHDMGAAMVCGVSGHAGLFSNTSDLIKIYQMLLNQGYYGGKQYLKEATIKKFTSRANGSTRRALGFDMKELRSGKSCNVAEFCSQNTFGHYGFTGTCVWVDPDYDLIYIFLCNRTYPSMDNNLLNKEEYRSKIQAAIYKSFLPSFVQDQS